MFVAGLPVNLSSSPPFYEVSGTRRRVAPPYLPPELSNAEDEFYNRHGVGDHKIIRVQYHCRGNGDSLVTLIVEAGETPLSMKPLVFSWVKTCYLPALSTLYIGTDKSAVTRNIHMASKTTKIKHGPINARDVVEEGRVADTYRRHSRSTVTTLDTISFYMYSLQNNTGEVVMDKEQSHHEQKSGDPLAHQNALISPERAQLGPPIVRLSNQECTVKMYGSANEGGELCITCGVMELSLDFQCNAGGVTVVNIDVPVSSQDESGIATHTLQISFFKADAGLGMQRPVSNFPTALVIVLFCLSFLLVFIVILYFRKRLLRLIGSPITNYKNNPTPAREMSSLRKNIQYSRISRWELSNA